MKCVTFKFLVLILIVLITFCGFQIFSKNIHYYAVDNYDASELNYEYNGRVILRQIPDTRDLRCPRYFNNTSKYKANVSIIITYHNESLSTLLLTINSIFHRTPLELLQEIIIIDDCSEDVTIIKNIKKATKSYSFTNHIKTIRNSKRLGLIKSRNFGAQISMGNYLMFLDSHCEVNEQWLESLLETIIMSEGSPIAVSPLLDKIDADSREYKATSAFVKGGFDWNLHFHWIPRDKTMNPIAPFRSPTFAGGIFLISRNWFFKLKAFNTRLEIFRLTRKKRVFLTIELVSLMGFMFTLHFNVWGGESLEFSLKLWLCGGDKAEIKIVPCSRVGHIFRKEHIFKFPEQDGQYVYLRNSKIIAETWLDQYKYNFYNQKPEAKSIALNFSLAEDKNFKNSMKCHKFEWYLQNIFPELRNYDNYTANGILISSADLSLNLCLHQEFSENGEPILELLNCFTPNITQWFLLKKTYQLQTDKGLCLNIQNLYGNNATKFEIILENCLSGQKQSWHRFGLQLRHILTGMCLETTVDFRLTANRCRKLAPMQYFKFERELEKL